MYDVFISYAHEDAASARDFAAALERAGLKVWWDRHLLPGDRLDASIQESLAGAKAVLVLWSAASVVSEWVRDEARYAAEQGKLVPVLIAKVEPPLGLRGLVTIDLSAWHGDVSDPLLKPLLTRLQVDAPTGTSPRARRFPVAAATLGTLSVLAAIAVLWRPTGHIEALPDDVGVSIAATPPATLALVAGPDAGQGPRKKRTASPPAVTPPAPTDAGASPASAPPAESARLQFEPAEDARCQGGPPLAARCAPPTLACALQARGSGCVGNEGTSNATWWCCPPR